jgi:translation initiation factor eIF-2B subunit beta
VLHFLVEAAKARYFHVIVAETGPDFQGRLMAKKLADAGIRTTLITGTLVSPLSMLAHRLFIRAS